MKGDFTRDTFDPAKHFSRVLMQQGRVALDADSNEQGAILLRYLRILARDIIGPYAAPAGAAGGFLLSADPNGAFAISKGRYFVDGLLVENDTGSCTYKNQPDYPVPADDALLAALNGAVTRSFWIYLDVWERHITPIEDDSIREKALGGPETCTRAKVVWQAKAAPLTPDLLKNLAAAEQKVTARINELWTRKAQLEKQFDTTAATDTTTQVNVLKQLQPVDDELARLTRLSLLPVHETLLSQLVSISNATLAARVDPGQKIEDACVTPPASKYRGAENQFYRVEIHRGGKAGEATFKWSRDNGSVAASWIGANELEVSCARGFSAGNWVELSDEMSDLLGKPGVLVQVVKVEGDVLSVDPAVTLPAKSQFPLKPKIRRWDQMATEELALVEGTVPIQESSPTQAVWMDLEDGVQVQFTAGGDYRSGDYWLIPARVATGNVEWPQDDELNPQPLPPRGIEHHYALLGVASWNAQQLNVQDVRCEFSPLFSTVTPNLVQTPAGNGLVSGLIANAAGGAKTPSAKVSPLAKPRAQPNSPKRAKKKK